MKTIELLMIIATILACTSGLYMSYVNHKEAKRFIEEERKRKQL